MKKFRMQYGIGSAKYLVSFHDGEKKHKDGSEFWDIEIFKNKKKLYAFMDDLRKNGYVYAD
jgi:hypothetical protein